MNQKQIGIADMQCWVFRKAQMKWHLTGKECAAIFKRYDLFGYISDCYDLLKVSSYQCALDELDSLLKSRGIVI